MTEDHVPARARLWLFVLGALVIFFLVVPVLIVIPISFSDFNAAGVSTAGLFVALVSCPAFRSNGATRRG